MLETTQTIYPAIPAIIQESCFSPDVVTRDWFLQKNHILRSDVMDLETKQQILQSLLFRMRQMSCIRRLSATKLKGLTNLKANLF